ncbi:MAG: hypothetical protein ACAI38_00590 [Myxococcota bacterium]
MRFAWRWPLVTASLLLAVPAAAAVPLVIEIDDGVAIADKAAVRKLVELNLHSSSETASRAGTTWVRVAPVTGSSFVRIDVDDPVTGKSLARTVDIFALGKAGASRLLATAIVELVSASWAELTTNPTPVAEPVGERAPLAARKDALAAVRTLDERWTQLAAFACAHGPFQNAGILVGGGVRVVPSIARRLALPIDIAFEHGGRDVTLGSIGVDVIGADVGLAYQRQWARWGLRAGAGGRGGVVRYRGNAAAQEAVGDVVWAPWGGPMASVSVFFLPAARLATELIVDGGYAFTSTRAGVDRGPDIGLSGAWAGLSLAFGLRAEH